MTCFPTRWVNTEHEPLSLIQSHPYLMDSTDNRVFGWVFEVEGVRECARKSCMLDSWPLSYTQHLIELIWVYSAGGGVLCASSARRRAKGPGMDISGKKRGLPPTG
jgi:hypothetical protein